MTQLNRLHDVAFRNQLQPIGNVVVNRALPLTIGIAAFQTPVGLGCCAIGSERVVDFTKLLFAFLRRDFFRICPPYFYKLKIVTKSFFHVGALINSISTGAAPLGNPEPSQVTSLKTQRLFRARTGTCQQAAQTCSLGFHQPEAANVVVEIFKNMLGPNTAGFRYVLTNHAAQMVAISFHFFTGNTLYFHQLVVVFVYKRVVHIQHIGEAARHTGTKVGACRTQHGNQSAGHILTAMIAGALNNCMGARVAYCESLTGGASRKQFAADGSVEAGVTDDRGLLGLENTAAGWLDDQFAASHAFAHIVVSIALKNQIKPTNVPDTKALARSAHKTQGYWRVCHSLVAVLCRNLTGKSRTNRAVAVSDAIIPGTTGFAFNGRSNGFQHLFRQQALVEWHIALDLAGLRFVRRNVIVRQQPSEV